MSDDLVKSHIAWLRGDHEQCNPFLADRIEALEARVAAAGALADEMERLIKRTPYIPAANGLSANITFEQMDAQKTALAAYRKTQEDTK